jgi:hypothetical protein
MGTGAYLGWISARGLLVDGSDFLPASMGERYLSALVGAILGLAANAGMHWLIAHTAANPIRLCVALLLLLATFLSAVLVLVLFH